MGRRIDDCKIRFCDCDNSSGGGGVASGMLRHAAGDGLGGEIQAPCGGTWWRKRDFRVDS